MPVLPRDERERWAINVAVLDVLAIFVLGRLPACEDLLEIKYVLASPSRGGL